MEFLSEKPAGGLYQFERELLETVRKVAWVGNPEEVLSEVAV